MTHGVVGVIPCRRLVERIAREGNVDSVPDLGDRAAAFWLVATGPTLWLPLRGGRDGGVIGVIGGVGCRNGCAAAPCWAEPSGDAGSSGPQCPDGHQVGRLSGYRSVTIPLQRSVAGTASPSAALTMTTTLAPCSGRWVTTSL